VEVRAWPKFEERVTGQNTPFSVEELAIIDQLVTEDDKPVDNLASSKQQRLLVESLYSSWKAPGGQTFLADTNVGVFHTLKAPPLVPDVFLSLGVRVAKDWWQKRHRSYFIREFGKPPEVVIEIVSNRDGKEDGSKLCDYAQMGIRYYAIFDPVEELGQGVLRLYELHQGNYVAMTQRWLPAVGLGLTLWYGTYEKTEEIWLRWCDREENLILTGAEGIEQEHQQVVQERRRAEQERLHKERLLAQLRALGIEPDK
jgi:Uma2 family endonuclease